jgi:hypothetical protein
VHEESEWEDGIREESEGGREESERETGTTLPSREKRRLEE